MLTLQTLILLAATAGEAPPPSASPDDAPTNHFIIWVQPLSLVTFNTTDGEIEPVDSAFARSAGLSIRIRGVEPVLEGGIFDSYFADNGVEEIAQTMFARAGMTFRSGSLVDTLELSAFIEPSMLLMRYAKSIRPPSISAESFGLGPGVHGGLSLRVWHFHAAVLLGVSALYETGTRLDRSSSSPFLADRTQKFWRVTVLPNLNLLRVGLVF